MSKLNDKTRENPALETSKDPALETSKDPALETSEDPDWNCISVDEAIGCPVHKATCVETIISAVSVPAGYLTHALKQLYPSDPYINERKEIEKCFIGLQKELVILQNFAQCLQSTGEVLEQMGKFTKGWSYRLLKMLLGKMRLHYKGVMQIQVTRAKTIAKNHCVTQALYAKLVRFTD